MKPDGNWADYLVTQANNGAGYALYMKSETVTGGKWTKIVETSDYNSSNSTKRGLAFADSDLDSYIKDVKIYVTGAVADADTKPATATQVMYEENFDAKPAYGNPDGSGMSYADGNLVLTENDETEVKAYWFNTEIPVGGYAEFRMNVGATSPNIKIYDGATYYGIFHRISYGVSYSSADAVLYSGDGGNVYRTWRVVRNADGSYSCYSKADSDTAWFPVAVNVAGKSVANSKHILIEGSKNYAGEAGVAKVDYMKVYGPALTKELTLTDGVGTVEAVEGTNLEFPKAVRALVKQGSTAKVVLFAEYDEETGILTNVASKVVPAGSDVSTVMYAMAGKTVKVFLWDNATHANLVDTTTLTAK